MTDSTQPATTSGRILVAEDSLVIRAVVCDQLEDEGYEVVEAIDGEDALEKCASMRPDAILLDIEMPLLDGHQVLARLRQDPELRDIPVIFLTGRTRTEDMVAGLRNGAHDYLRKPVEPAELIARVGGAVRIKRLQDELRERNDELRRLSETDALTGVTNRRAIDERLEVLTAASRRHQQPLSLLLFDIDHFKRINDSKGHPAGDRVLQEFVARLRAAIRPDDVIGRWGGEEFVIIASQTSSDQALLLAERARSLVADQPFDIDHEALDVTVSVGCSSTISASATELVQRADVALYRSKSEGRNRVTAGDDPSVGD